MTAMGAGVADMHENNVPSLLHSAEHWQVLSLAAVLAIMLSWGIAVRRREKCCGVWWVLIVSFLALWIGLELMMV